MTTTINGIPLNVLESGSGPVTLVFLHYFGGSALEWQFVTANLSGNYRCLAVDLRGFGDSQPVGGFSTHTTFSVDDMADDVVALIRQSNVTQYVLVGHSMSGKVALALAARQPAGLLSLVLVSPSPPVPEPIPDDERQKLIVTYGQRPGAEETLKNITEVDISNDVREQIIADDLRTAKPAWMAWLTAGSLEDISERMAGINVPVHIIVGSDDRALSPDVQNELVLPYIKKATVTTVPKAGHLLPWEIPDKLAAFITKKIST
ncbi:alpha/beta fold hydrolase [Spirosoma fluminis]